MTRRKSGILFGVADDAKAVAARIKRRREYTMEEVK